MTRISVLIPTLGRTQELIDTVRSLCAQSRLPDELVVVDQNDPSLPEVDAALASVTGFQVVHLKQRSPGVAINYNRCLEAATGEVVLFLDDDIVPDADLIRRHLQYYDSTAGGSVLGVAGVAGRVTQPEGDLPPERIDRAGQVGIYHRWSGTISANFNATRARDVQLAPGGNMSFRRLALVATGGFDEGFGGNGYFFESDASLRFSQSGNRLVFEPGASVRHLMAPAGGARVRDKAEHTYWFVRNGLRLCRRHSPGPVALYLTVRSLAYVLAKAIRNGNLQILWRGLEALRDGWTQSMEVQR